MFLDFGYFLKVMFCPGLCDTVIEAHKNGEWCSAFDDAEFSRAREPGLNKSNLVTYVYSASQAHCSFLACKGQPVMPEMSGAPLPESRSNCFGRGTVTVALLVPSNHRLLEAPVRSSDQLKGSSSDVM